MKARNLGRFIKSQREMAGVTQGKLSQILGYSNPQFISNWERGLSSPPPKIMSKLADALDLNRDVMMNIILTEQKAFWEAHIFRGRRNEKTRGKVLLRAR